MSALRIPVVLLVTTLAACGSSKPADPDGGTPDPLPEDAGMVDAGEPDAGLSCTGGLTECNGACVDLQSDANHCGTCDLACSGGSACVSAICTDCAAGESRSCYEGPEGTAGVGVCLAGTQSCVDGQFGPCESQQLPSPEICGNGLDEDCNGVPDDAPDFDGDGFTACTGDCDDNAIEVNAGAFDFPGNGLDDDCDGTPDLAEPCDVGLVTDTANAADHALALDLCRFSNGSTWGVIAANWTLADGTGMPNAAQRSVRTGFGSSLLPRQGAAMVAIGTGPAATPGDPGYAAPQNGTKYLAASAPPSDWFAANSNKVPVPSICPAILDQAIAHDPAMLTLQLRVPTNAYAFSLDAFLLTADFPEYVCTQFVDQFVALLDSVFSATPANPSDKNLASAHALSGAVALSSNLAALDDGQFEICTNGATSCTGTTKMITTCTSASELGGTGYDATANVCQPGDLIGGGTGWKRLRGNVVPGETITLRLAIWDGGDGTFDTKVLLDNFTWYTTAGPTGF